MEVPIAHDWIQTTEEIITVKMPTFDAILGDKLTAFAPKTTGILYTKGRPVEIIKQLFDVSFLMDNISDLKVVSSSYAKVVEEELVFRKLELSPEQVLEDTQEACYILSARDTKSEEFKHLQLGVSNFTNFTITKFNIEEAITAAAKVTYLSEIIKANEEITIEKFDNPLEVKDWLIDDEQFNKLTKPKKSNPESIFYWFKTILIFTKKNLTLSNQEISSLKDAIKYYRAREGNFSSQDPVLDIIEKLNSKTKFKSFNEVELTNIKKVVNENVLFMSAYEYAGLTQEQAITNKQQILEPLFKLRNKIL